MCELTAKYFAWFPIYKPLGYDFLSFCKIKDICNALQSVSDLFFVVSVAT